MADLRDEIKTAKKHKSKVACLLADAGLEMNLDASARIISELRVFPKGNLFLKSVVKAAEWAGFVRDDPDWPTNGMRFLETGAPHIKSQYRKGYHGNANPIAYLETWSKVLNEARSNPPTEKASTSELVQFEQDAFSALKHLEWKHERDWVGAWSFHGAFKIFLLHQRDFWKDPLVDAVVMPMGGTTGKYSFESGWRFLESNRIVPALPVGEKFDQKLAASTQAHSMVKGLAALANSRAIHVNSGIYLLGSQ